MPSSPKRRASRRRGRASKRRASPGRARRLSPTKRRAFRASDQLNLLAPPTDNVDLEETVVELYLKPEEVDKLNLQYLQKEDRIHMKVNVIAYKSNSNVPPVGTITPTDQPDGSTTYYFPRVIGTQVLGFKDTPSGEREDLNIPYIAVPISPEFVMANQSIYTYRHPHGGEWKILFEPILASGRGVKRKWTPDAKRSGVPRYDTPD